MNSKGNSKSLWKKMEKDVSKAKHVGQSCQCHAKERKKKKDACILNCQLRNTVI